MQGHCSPAELVATSGQHMSRDEDVAQYEEIVTPGEYIPIQQLSRRTKIAEGHQYHNYVLTCQETL